jgi:hypothetical protein
MDFMHGLHALDFTMHSILMLTFFEIEIKCNASNKIIKRQNTAEKNTLCTRQLNQVFLVFTNKTKVIKLLK